MKNSLPAPENRFPDCVRMELEIVQIQPEGFLGRIIQREPEQLDLILNIRFGKHREKIFGGSVTFGLKRGELKVNLTNGEVPLRNFKLKDEFQTVVEKEVQEEEARKSNIRAGLPANLGITVTREETGKTAEKTKYKEYQVSTKGELKDPTWVFAVKTKREILQGLLQNAELASIDVKAKPCSLAATFNVPQPEDICLSDAKWLLSEGITKKKWAIIERGIVRRFLDKKLRQKPYLSQVKLEHE